MDGEAIGSGTVGTVVSQDGYKTLRTNAKRRFKAVLNSISKTMPIHDFDVYERRRIETLVDVLTRRYRSGSDLPFHSLGCTGYRSGY
jgi:hypothetical protein